MRQRRLGYSITAVLLLLVFAAHTVPYLNRSLRYDETYTATRYVSSPVSALGSYEAPNNHMLHSLFVWMVTQTMGMSPFTLCFPAFAAALIGLALMMRVGRKLANPTTGIAGAVLLSLCFAYGDYAVNARGYTLSVALTLILIELIYSDRARRYPLLLTSAALMLTMPSLAILIACAAVFLVGRGWYFKRVTAAQRYHARRMLPPMITGAIIGSMFYLPSVLNGVIESHIDEFGMRDIASLLNDIFATWFTSSFMAIVVGVLLLLAIPHRRLWHLMIFMVGGALGLLLIQGWVIGNLFFGRNYLYLAPVIFLAAGAGLARVVQHFRIPAWTLLTLMIFVPSPLFGVPTEVDEAIAFLDSYADEKGAMVLGCCLNEPVIYTMIRAGRSEQVIPNNETEWLYFIPNLYYPMDYLVNMIGLPIEQCSTVQWQSLTIERCHVAGR